MERKESKWIKVESRRSALHNDMAWYGREELEFGPGIMW